MSSVHIVRLLSGEELMGEVRKNADGSVTIKDVCQVATSYADPQQATAKIGIAPYLPYADLSPGLTIEKHYIGYIAKPVTELYNEYNKIFGSGIVIPDQGVTKGTGGDFASKFVKG